MIYVYVMSKKCKYYIRSEIARQATQITDQHLLLHHSSEVSGHLKVGTHLYTDDRRERNFAVSLIVAPKQRSCVVL